MELKLLTPPTDSPFRIQPTRSLPSEASFAVDTGALPRSLPQQMLDPNYGTQPWESLARLGSVGVQVSTKVGDLLAEAQARKNEADDVAEASGLYTQMVLGFDQTVDQLKVTNDHKSLRPAYDKAYQEAATEAVAKASNERVRDRLGLKIAGYRVTKSAEISEATTRKFLGYQTATLDTDLEVLQKKATEARPGFEQEHAMRDIETRFLEASHSGAFTADGLVNQRQKVLGAIKMDRAKNDAFLAPISMLERISRGEMDDLSVNQKRDMAEYAESRVRTLRSDQENADAKERRAVKEQQDDLAITWRQKISEHYKPGAPSTDLTMELNGAARTLGEGNHKELLEMDRLYRERALKPTTIKSDKGTVGEITAAYRTGNVTKYTDADLLRLLNNDTLDEGDHRYLSGLRAEVIAHQKAEAKKGQTDAEHTRKEQIDDGEKAIEELLSRSNRMLGTQESHTSQILVNDAKTEYHQRLAKDPNAIPDDVATDVVVGRIQKAEKLGPGTIPYKTKEEVAAAFAAGEITSKRLATRYYRLLEALEKGKKGTEAAPLPPAAPGLMERFKGLFSSPESPVRAPVKP